MSGSFSFGATMHAKQGCLLGVMCKEMLKTVRPQSEGWERDEEGGGHRWTEREDQLVKGPVHSADKVKLHLENKGELNTTEPGNRTN